MMPRPPLPAPTSEAPVEDGATEPTVEDAEESAEEASRRPTTASTSNRTKHNVLALELACTK
jgi:hypothetical protein